MSSDRNKKISELDPAGALSGAELVEVVKNGVNVRTTASALSSGAGVISGPGSSTSGDIVTFNGTGGTVIQDSGTKITDLAPGNVDYLVKTANGTLTAERVVTDTASITWDWATGGQAKANIVTGTASGVAPSDADFLVGTATASLSAERVVTNTPSIIWDISTAGTAKANVVGFGTATIPVDFKDSVAVATTANITLSGEQTIDSILTSGSRVLVKNQTTGSENGIYVSAAGAWSRSTDADTSAEVTSGMMTYVEGGTVSGGLIYMLSTTGTITLGSTSLTFTAIVLPFSFFVGTTVSGTSYTTVLTDSGKRLNLTNASAKTVTVPPNSSVAYAVNTEIEVFNAGAGAATIAPGSGVTINSQSSILTLGQYSYAKLKKRASPNTWDLSGIVSVTASAITFTNTQRVLGRNTAGGGSGEEVTASQLLDWVGGTNGQILVRTGGTWAGTKNLTVGFTATSFSNGTKSSGTLTPDPANGAIQHYTNGGAHTLAPPSTGTGDSLTMVLDVTNNGSAGAITTSGFTKVTGDSLATTNALKYRGYISVGNAGSHLNWQAMQ